MRLVPDLFDGEQVTTACAWTTRPKFLVFGSENDKPVCVVQFGREEELKRVHEILCKLYSRLSNLVAEPLVCMPWQDGTWVQIQAGLAGMPWFRLASTFRFPGDWTNLRCRSLAVLERLHVAVQEVSEWTHEVSPAQQLLDQSTLYAERGG